MSNPIEAEIKRLRKEAVIAWEVCASIHREYAKKRDPFFTTRQADFVKHADDCRKELNASPDDIIQNSLFNPQSLIDAAENTCIAWGMGWDMEGVIDALHKALPTSKQEEKFLTYSEQQTMKRALLRSSNLLD